MELPEYNPNKAWSDCIELSKLLKNSIDYNTDEDVNNNVNEIDLNSVNFSLDNEKILNEIETILIIDNFKDYTSLDILKKQDLLSSYLSKSIQNTNINIIFLKKILVWLMDTSNYLNNKVGLKIYNHNDTLIKQDKVIRSSYKFCNFKHNCSYNYDNKKKGCYADHYVHNMVYADIFALLNCIDKYHSDKDVIQNKEIVKCINTISFVIRHMYEELHNLCMYCPNSNEHDKYHIVKITKNDKKYMNVKRRDIDI